MLQDVEDYKNYLLQFNKVSESSIASYVKDVEQFVTYLQERSTWLAEEITEMDLREYGDYLLDAGWKKATVARKIVSAKAFYRFLYRNHNINLEYAELLKAPRVEKGAVKYLSEEEMTRLVESPTKNTIKEIRDKAILELLYATGMRVSELISLQKENLDLKMDCVILSGANGRRIVPYGAPARDALARYLTEARSAFLPEEEHTYIFLNHSGKQLSRQGIFKLVKRYGEKAGIEQVVTPDMIRHSFVKHLLEHGAELSSVQKMMGHSSLAITAVYLPGPLDSEQETYRKAHPRA